MSSLHEIDPRLRDAPRGGAFLQQHLPAATFPNRSPGPPQPYQSFQDASPQQNLYVPETPLSAGTAVDGDGNNGSLNDPKRPRACEACRGLKVRCEPDPNNEDAPCKRCAKANRNCVVTVPSRKRQKKTDSRVAELEKKIDALTASLHASKSAPGSIDPSSENGLEQEGLSGQGRHSYEQVTNGGYGTPFVARPEARMTSNEWARYPKSPDFDKKAISVPPMVVAGQKRKHIDREYSMASESQSSISAGSMTRVPADHGPGAQQQYELVDSWAGPPPPKPAQTHEYADVIDRGIVTAEIATEMFNCYVERMAPQMPAVVFPAGTTAADVRKTKPILFLSILSASSGINYPKLQRGLTKECTGIYADRIMCQGEKTLELIQALHVSTLWYFPPEHFEEVRFYQLIHIAAAMAIDIGLGKRTKANKPKNSFVWKDQPWRRSTFPAPESIEARRTWLGCYLQCCNVAMGLRRPNLIRWTPFMTECIDTLETSPEAAPSDKLFCQWVRSQHIAEEVGTQFCMDDPMANVSIADPNVQYALKGFERDLEKWRSQVPPEVQTPGLKLTGHVMNLYMHEVAMHVDHNVDEFRHPFTDTTLRGEAQPDLLTPYHINALSVCLTSIDGIFETFLNLDVDTVRCLPVYHFVRMAYAVVVLIKMYFAASAPSSEFGKVINKDNMKVEQYLDDLTEVFKQAAADEKSRPAGKFLMALIMLRSWFQRQREGKLPPGSETATCGTQPPGSRGEGKTPAATPSESSANPPRQVGQQRHGQQQGYSPAANTPLQLLSEVATGNSRGQSVSDSVTQYTESSNDWQQQQSVPQYDPSLNLPQGMQEGYGNMSMGGNIDPSLGMDVGYIIGDGFEQAIGMTVGGVGDIGNYFIDDSFFGKFMDSVGGGAGFDGF